MIDIVLFDFGGVISDEGFRSGLFVIARANNLNPEAFHDDVCRIIAATGYLTGRSDEASFWTLLRREYGLAQTDRQLRDAILGRFVLRPRMLGIVDLLRVGGVRAGIISDQTNWLDELDRRDSFFARFDLVFNSFHLHASKHEGSLFDVVAMQLGMAPERLLLVDDNAGNTQRARQRGYAVIFYKDERSFMEEMRKFFPDIF
jgi:FMN phosphatase YigB (HAD superfamily)